MTALNFNPALVPDDRARVAPPQDWTLKEQIEHDREFAELKEWHFVRVRTLVIANLRGQIPFCCGLLQGRLQKLDAGELLDIITDEASPQDMAKIFARAPGSGKLASKLIAAYVDKTAAHLASLEMNEVPA